MSKQPTILVLEPKGSIRTALTSAFASDYSLQFAASADEAIELADVRQPDVVLVELSLAGHSGLEFLYEFRSYIDWRHVPVIVYMSQQVKPELLSSIGWKELDIAAYLYKPNTSLQQIRAVIESSLADE